MEGIATVHASSAPAGLVVLHTGLCLLDPCHSLKTSPPRPTFLWQSASPPHSSRNPSPQMTATTHRAQNLPSDTTGWTSGMTRTKVRSVLVRNSGPERTFGSRSTH
ncbi:hypothetical protein L210DRAFT_3543534 [Boletus edulis BED1]|uniref:Uncharacterized protein n=1 Tax=Boletus edulis BED1 TaxID=1328754 RepID=A0AAD4GE05_BOLED|nr:hypothetical protein L210DRAFT_3543534 [Boletus edulis BED1]